MIQATNYGNFTNDCLDVAYKKKTEERTRFSLNWIVFIVLSSLDLLPLSKTRELICLYNSTRYEDGDKCRHLPKA